MLPYLFRFPDWLPLIGGEYVTSFGVMMFLAFVTAGAVLRKEMERAAKKLDFERAADLRDRLLSLEKAELSLR